MLVETVIGCGYCGAPLSSVPGKLYCSRAHKERARHKRAHPPAGRRSVVVCKRGHILDEANTYRESRGTRQCRTCALMRARRNRDSWAWLKSPREQGPPRLREFSVLICCEVCRGWAMVASSKRKRQRFCSTVCAGIARRRITEGPWVPSDWTRLASHRMGRGWPAIRSTVLKEEPDCRICGEPATEVDHITPRARGGSDAPENLQPLCRGCHRVKTNRERIDGLLTSVSS